MQTDFKKLANQQQEFISQLVQQLNHEGRKNESSINYSLQMKLEEQYKSYIFCLKIITVLRPMETNLTKNLKTVEIGRKRLIIGCF